MGSRCRIPAVSSTSILTAILTALGVGFLLANARIAIDYLQFRRRRPQALLIWPPVRGSNSMMSAALGVALAVLVVMKTFWLQQAAFGEAMMCLYYLLGQQLARNIGRGFYNDGIWTDGGFLKFDDIGGITWREGDKSATLIVAARAKNQAWRLTVPGDRYGAARRVLRDKIKAHAIQFSGTGLDLDQHDERDDV